MSSCAPIERAFLIAASRFGSSKDTTAAPGWPAQRSVGRRTGPDESLQPEEKRSRLAMSTRLGRSAASRSRGAGSNIERFRFGTDSDGVGVLQIARLRVP